MGAVLLLSDQAEPSDKEAADEAANASSFRLRHGAVEFRDGDEWQLVCRGVSVVALARDAFNCNWGLLIRVVDCDGVVHEWCMPKDMLAGDGRECREHLLRLGADIPPERTSRERFNRYLLEARPNRRVRCVDRIGWHNSSFVLPDRTIGASGGSGEDPVLQRTLAEAGHEAFSSAGTLSDWRAEVAQPAVGNRFLQLAICASLAGPLLRLVGAESGGFHLYGNSSTGKTTAASVAASVWGSGDEQDGFPRRWRATDNGLEAIAAAHCDTFLVLDEMGQADPNVVSKCAYMLAGGGKQRAGQQGQAAPQRRWRIVYLSTGELDFGAKIAEDRRLTAMAGQEVRLISLAADAGAGMGLFEDLHGNGNPGAFSDHLKEATKTFYGTAGPAFVERLVPERDEARRRAMELRDGFVTAYLRDRADGQVQRVAKQFGLLAAAGELAISFGILPWSEGDANRAVGTCFLGWLERRPGGLGASEDEKMIATVRKFISEHGESRFAPDTRETDDCGRPLWRAHNCVGFRKKEGECIRYCFFTHAWAEVCRPYEGTTVAKVLAARRYLKTGSKSGVYTVQERQPRSDGPAPGSKGTRASVYVVYGCILEEGGDEDDSPEGAAPPV